MEGFKRFLAAATGLLGASTAEAQEGPVAPQQETIVGVEGANFQDPAAPFPREAEQFEQSNDPTQAIRIRRPEEPDQDILGLRPEEESLRHGIPGLRHAQAGIVESAHGDDIAGVRISTIKEED